MCDDRNVVPPTQRAYDRIQRAATRSPITIGAVTVVHELYKHGVRLRATAWVGGVDHVVQRVADVTWHELAFDKEDPLRAVFGALVKDVIVEYEAALRSMAAEHDGGARAAG